ncbi:MAG TPA: heavy-metal-associated domain-containing protein [Desulfuromonadales bacterium]|nr:heavy-metal-associated domain-containing protein [Desulfuromonadales bacterium]
MSTKKIFTLFLVAVLVVLLGVLAFRVRPATTADSVAVLKTTGMTCGSCSSKISAALSSVKGVAVTEVDLEGGWVIVGYNTSVVQPETLAEKLSKTGFGSSVNIVLTPERYRQITGRNIGQKASSQGCCGGKDGGCSSKKQI